MRLGAHRLAPLAVAVSVAACPPVAAAALAPVAVSTQVTCSFVQGPTVYLADLTRYRDVEMSCEAQGSDRRVTGTQTGVLYVDEHPDGSAELWHSYRLANSDGAWQGAAAGLVAAGYTTHRLHVVASGSGAYAGLTLELDVTGEDQVHFTATGTIRPAP